MSIPTSRYDKDEDSLLIKIFKGIGLIIFLIPGAIAAVNMFAFWLPSFAWLFAPGAAAPSLAVILTCVGFTVTSLLAIGAAISLYAESNKSKHKERSILPMVLSTILFLATLSLTLFTGIYFDAPSSQFGVPAASFFSIASSVGTAAFLGFAIYEYKHTSYDSSRASLAREESLDRLLGKTDKESATSTKTMAPQPLATASSAITSAPNLSHRANTTNLNAT
ncbi:MAG: hypothetical protein M1561_05165 [Gammaproteobacteria bacterium]|nr:hypothetical protein [Gammaproteobacteria bacterium]